MVWGDDLVEHHKEIRAKPKGPGLEDKAMGRRKDKSLSKCTSLYFGSDLYN